MTAVFKRWVSPDFARKLERERDAARRDADALAEALYCFNDAGLCKAFRDQMGLSLKSHGKLCKMENRPA